MGNNAPTAAEIAALVTSQLQARGIPATTAPVSRSPLAGPSPAQVLGAVNGAGDIAIIIGSTTYELTVATPSSANNQEYVFNLTMTASGGTAQTIAGFKYKDGGDWQVTVGLPQISIGSVTIKTFTLSLGEGTV